MNVCVSFYVQRQRKVRVKAQQQHEHGADEIVDGRRSLRLGEHAAQDLDDGRERAADVGTEHHGASVLERKFGGHSVDGVLVDAAGHFS